MITSSGRSEARKSKTACWLPVAKASRSAVLMLRHLDEEEAAERLAKALRGAVVDDGVQTRDLGGEADTHQFTEAILRRLG